MNICIVSFDYPSKKSSTFSFVKQLVDEFANQGHHCYVLSPFSITKYKCVNRVVEKSSNKSGGSVTLIRPNFISCSSIRIGSLCFTDLFFKLALKKAFSLLPVKPDLIWGHFWSSAYRAYPYAKKMDVPLFVATGESFIPREKYDLSFRKYVSGVVCVSSKNKKETLMLGLSTEDKCIVIPNAINKNLFFKMDKNIARKQYFFPQNGFIVAFVGWFDNRKGCRRVADAIKKLNNPNIFSIFIGDGPDEPDCENILYKGSVKHENICSLLNCANVFVLPTLAEGCCNAIIEAMACGLPIVSSDCDFNNDILDDSNSIRVNPNSVEEIAESINKLYNDNMLQKKMSESSLKKASNLTIDKRAKAIIQFIETRISGKTTNV